MISAGCHPGAGRAAGDSSRRGGSQPRPTGGSHRARRCVRVADELPVKLVIADESLVLFDMADAVAETGATTSLIIEHAALALTLRHAFMAIWDRALPLDKALAHQT